MDAAWIPLVFSVSLFAALGNTLLKLGATRGLGEAPITIGTLHHTLLKPVIIAGVAAYAVSQVLWITELRVADLSLAYPLQIGLNFTMITGIAWLYLKEPMAAGKLMGIALILAGIVLVTTG